jgi:hypothetical protein
LTGIKSMFASNMIRPLIEKCKFEADTDILTLVYDLISKLIRTEEGFIPALSLSLIEAIAQTLRTKTNPATLYAACKCLAAMCVFSQGKDHAVAVGCVTQLVPLIGSPTVEVRRGALLALMNITNTQSGKKAALQGYAIPALAKRIFKEADEDCIIYAMNAMASVAEHPEGRRSDELCGPTTLSRIRWHQEYSKSEVLKSAAAETIYKLQWAPGEYQGEWKKSAVREGDNILEREEKQRELDEKLAEVAAVQKAVNG